MKAIEKLLQEREARIRELEASRDQYQEWAVDYEQRIERATAILEDIGTVDAQRVLAALEGK